nr:ORF128 [Acipenserid herpesvirus 1]
MKGCCVTFKLDKKRFSFGSDFTKDLMEACGCILETHRRCHKSYMSKRVDLNDHKGYTHRMELGCNFEGTFMKLKKGNDFVLIFIKMFAPMCNMLQAALKAIQMKTSCIGEIYSRRYRLTYWLTYQGCLRVTLNHPLHSCKIGFHKSLFVYMLQVFKDCDKN